MPVSSLFRSLAPLIVLLALSMLSSRAELLYDNSDTGGTNVYYSVVEYGDEIVLGGTSRIVSQVMFEYFGDFTPAGDETARLRLYKNDGPLTSAGDATPGTMLFDSGDFSLAPGYQTKAFGGLNVTVPGDLTWTIQFAGMTGADNDRAGLVFRDKPSVGSSYDDFWQKNGANWQLFSWNGSPIANFAARLTSGVDATRVGIRREGNTVVVEWSGLSILQVGESARGPFVDFPSVRNRYVISPGSAPMRFWRLRD